MEKVCIIGSGNWGTAISMIIGKNAKAHPKIFAERVDMYVFEEVIPDRGNLSEIINKEHENVKYLPGRKLPENVVANPSLTDSVKDATILVFVQPHQFVPRTLKTIKDFVKPGARAVSLIKGFNIIDGKLILISDMIKDTLGIECSVLMGANIADEVADGKFCETTIGSRIEGDKSLWMSLFNLDDSFKVTVVKDVYGTEICGSLKNIVALGAGFVDGLGYGGNTKAAIIRIGLTEMIRFGKTFFKGVEDSTFLESCGVGDLITTCYGGRNRKCAEHFVKTGEDWDVIETKLLNGQKLQGTLTAIEVHEFLEKEGVLEKFPLFGMIYRIVKKEEPPMNITKF